MFDWNLQKTEYIIKQMIAEQWSLSKQLIIVLLLYLYMNIYWQY